MTRLAALLLMLLMPAVAGAQLMAWAGPRGLTSATINSDGDTLTVVAETTVTLSSAAGFSIEFDNAASRTLAYVSGSGTDTLVFSINAVSPSTDDRAPVGTVVTLDYDADTGNATGLEETVDFAVTNDSTQIPDPDLPQNLPTTTRPTGWNGTADHTPDNITELNELTDGDGNGDVQPGDIVELDAGGTYTGASTTAWTIAANIQGTANAPIIFRTSGHAGLPADGTRIASDEDSLATVSNTGAFTSSKVLHITKGSGASGASYLRFIGIKFLMNGSFTDIVNIITVGEVNATRSTTELPVSIGFNQCWVTAADASEGREAVRFDATDSWFVDSRFTNLDAGGEDGSTGIRFYVGARMVFDNNYFETESAAVFLGGNETTRCDDIQISNNQITRPAGWDDANGIQKAAGVEIKTCLRCLIENCFVENGTWMQGGFAAITIKAGEPSGAVTDKWSRHVTVKNCDLSNNTIGVVVAESGSSGSGQGPNWDILVEDCVIRGTPGSNAAFIIPSNQGTAGTLDRVIFRHNTFDKATYCSLTTPGRYLIFRDNITTNFSGNVIGTGGVVLETIWGSTYDFQYNAIPGGFVSQYDNYGSITGVLDNNLFPADSSTLGYSTYPPTALAHLEITGGVCNNAGSDATDIGADIAGLITSMSGVVE